jgi:hypothetical protein
VVYILVTVAPILLLYATDNKDNDLEQWHRFGFALSFLSRRRVVLLRIRLGFAVLKLRVGWVYITFIRR